MELIETLETTTFSGRRFTRVQLGQVRETVAMFQRLSRNELAQTLCEHLQWFSPNKTNKVISCLKLLEELEEQGIIKLPAKRETQKRTYLPSKIEAEHEPEFRTSLEEVGPIVLERVMTSVDREEYQDYIRKYHYLGFKQAIGHQIAYFIVAENSKKKLGCILFSGSATYSLAARDAWIGWDENQRKKLLPLVLRNNRFLIFPWISVPHLASKALSMVTTRVAADWLQTYGYQPVLIETFVDKEKYSGTSYQAANWQLVGETTSKKIDDSGNQKSIKDIYLYPLRADFRKQLTGETSATAQKKQYRNDIKASHSRAVDDDFIQVWKNVIHIVHEVASEYDEKWQIRKRLISTLILILFVFRLVSSKKAQNYGTTIDELWDSCKALDIPLPQKCALAPSSLCDARKKLDEKAFISINQKIIQQYLSKGDESERWMGHRIFAVDGSKMTLPRTLIENGYKLPSETSGYPQGLLSCLYLLKTKIPFDFALSSHANERIAAEQHLACLEKGDVVVYDRGYISYYLLYLHVKLKIFGVFRLPISQTFLEVQKFIASGEVDSIVTINPLPSLRSTVRKEHPGLDVIPIKFRLVKYTYAETTYYVGTTLLDPKYTLQDIADVYFARWGVEELYKISKHVFVIEDFHGKTERGVRQELYAHFVLITMNRIFANYSDSQLNGLESSPQLKGRIFQTNFTNCVHVLTRSLEGLLLFHNAVKEKIQDAFNLMTRQFYKVRNGRSYLRKSMRPHRRWQPSSKKYRKSKASSGKPASDLVFA